jgi:hypothetical protein
MWTTPFLGDFCQVFQGIVYPQALLISTLFTVDKNVEVLWICGNGRKTFQRLNV